MRKRAAAGAMAAIAVSAQSSFPVPGHPAAHGFSGFRDYRGVRGFKVWNNPKPQVPNHWRLSFDKHAAKRLAKTMCTTSRTTLHLRRRRRCALLRRLQNSSDQKRPAWSGGERMTAAEELRAAAPFFRRSGAIANYVDQSVATESLQGLESYLQTPSTVGSATNAGRAGACNLPVANLQATRSPVLNNSCKLWCYVHGL